MKKLRILIADDHGMIRQGIRALIKTKSNWELCCEVENGRKAVELAIQMRPDIAVLDITMPELNGLEATRRIRTALPNTQVLILTMHDSEALAREVLGAGARGYLLKNDAPELLPQAIEALADGRTYFTSAVSEVVLGGYANPPSEDDGQPLKRRITPREREIIQLLAEGKSNKQIADLLGITFNTVETHRKHVMGKLKIRTIGELIRYAIRNKLADP